MSTSPIPAVEIDYIADVPARFACVAAAPWSMLLDSCNRRGSGAGRYDILVAAPRVTLVSRGATTEIRFGDALTISADDPFALVQHWLGPPRVAPEGLPFCGGAVGYFAYGLGPGIELLAARQADDVGLPDMAIGIYDEALVVDHLDRRAWCVGEVGAGHPLQEVLASTHQAAQAAPFDVQGPVRADITFDGYTAALRRIKRYLNAGDCYQVNFTQRFSAPVSGAPWSAYVDLRARNPAPFAAYLSIPGGAVLCSSPERFISVRDGGVETQPIKGTRPRSADPKKDAHQAQQLRGSVKDQAENLMIVDLLRNDLSKTCLPGSVEVPNLFELQSFATVHHLVSTVRGRLAPDMHALDVLRACFPGGSITGAPKVRAMQIIEELEPCRRGVYCGSIGYIGYDGSMDTNIAIRTMVYNGARMFCAAGGGIVIDSILADEYQESLDKAAAMLKVLNRT